MGTAIQNEYIKLNLIDNFTKNLDKSDYFEKFTTDTYDLINKIKTPFPDTRKISKRPLTLTGFHPLSHIINLETIAADGVEEEEKELSIIYKSPYLGSVMGAATGYMSGKLDTAKPVKDAYLSLGSPMATAAATADINTNYSGHIDSLHEMKEMKADMDALLASQTERLREKALRGFGSISVLERMLEKIGQGMDKAVNWIKGKFSAFKKSYYEAKAEVFPTEEQLRERYIRSELEWQRFLQDTVNLGVEEARMLKMFDDYHAERAKPQEAIDGLIQAELENIAKETVPSSEEARTLRMFQEYRREKAESLAAIEPQLLHDEEQPMQNRQKVAN